MLQVGGEKERKKENSIHPLVRSLVWLERLGLDRTKARIQELHPGLTKAQGPKIPDSSVAFPDAGTTEACTGVHMGYWCCRLKSVCHHANHFIYLKVKVTEKQIDGDR